VIHLVKRRRNQCTLTNNYHKRRKLNDPMDSEAINLSAESKNAGPSQNETQQNPTLDLIDAQNNNILNMTDSEIGSIANMIVENIDFSESEDVKMNDIENNQLTIREKELIKMLQLKNVKIKELENLLNRKNDEIANLKSHLDKFQSVFPFRTGAMTTRKIGRNIQRQRAQGISAEPQSQSSMHELLNVSFPKYEKDEK
jgi:Coiled-coil N-terminus of cGMP-dependent protein kinase